MGKVTFVGGNLGMKVPSRINPVFENNNWATIIEACQTNFVPDTWNVGDSKTMTINGTDYLIDIIGKNHDTYSDGSGKAPLTFQMHNVSETTYVMNSTATNSGGWKSCSMRTTTLPAILATMPTEVQAGIKEVNKLTSAGMNSSTIDTTADKLFLLSEIEVFGTQLYAQIGEGTQYDYYKAGNMKDKTIVNTSTSAQHWARSPRVDSIETFVTFAGSEGKIIQSYVRASNLMHVAFAFCF